MPLDKPSTFAVWIGSFERMSHAWVWIKETAPDEYVAL